MNSFEQLKSSFYSFIEKTYTTPQSVLSSINFNLNADSSKTNFGDISSNAALVLAQHAKSNPRTIAQNIISQFSHDSISAITQAGPGFLNFDLTEKFYIIIARELYTRKEQFFKDNAVQSPHKYCLEFVSANPTGPLHLGHGRGGIIGDVLGNILKFLGHTVTKEFYINDAGAQIERLGISLKVRCQQALGFDTSMPEDGYQGEYLQELAKEFINSFGPESINQPTEIFSAYAKEKLLHQIKTTLSNYGITYDVWFSEKTLHDQDMISKALLILEKGNFTYFKDDALWFTSTQFGDDKDRVLQRGTGNYTYISADVAYLQNKLNRGFNKLIMILGQDHHSYVIRMKAIMQALGYNPDDLDIILYQLVSLKEGSEYVKMSKRAGKIVSLADITTTVGKDVARFFYLNRKADAHLEFDIDLALKKTEENPVYYIQYAYVRINSILQKAQEHSEFKDITISDLENISTSEAQLLKKIITLKDLLIAISSHYQTHLLTYYALELAHEFHRYYSHNRVLDSVNNAQSRARLALLHLLKETFELCLALLGISAPESM